MGVNAVFCYEFRCYCELLYKLDLNGGICHMFTQNFNNQLKCLGKKFSSSHRTSVFLYQRSSSKHFYWFHGQMRCVFWSIQVAKDSLCGLCYFIFMFIFVATGSFRTVILYSLECLPQLIKSFFCSHYCHQLIGPLGRVYKLVQIKFTFGLRE